MKAALYFRGDDVFKEFPVPEKHVAGILQSLQPASRFGSQAKWQTAGHLILNCKDGTEYRVDLHQTRQPVSAFSVHRSDWNWHPGWFVSNYFRGGSDDTIRQAIAAAHADFVIEAKDNPLGVEKDP